MPFERIVKSLTREVNDQEIDHTLDELINKIYQVLTLNNRQAINDLVILLNLLPSLSKTYSDKFKTDLLTRHDGKTQHTPKNFHLTPLFVITNNMLREYLDTIEGKVLNHMGLIEAIETIQEYQLIRGYPITQFPDFEELKEKYQLSQSST